MVDPVLLDLVASLAKAEDRPALVGLAGAQGSGKTTLARAAARALGGVAFSLDDVYRTRAERDRLAAEVHPLLAVRGPPGTHDLALAETTIAALSTADADTQTSLPAFDKLADERALRTDWPVFRGRPAAILIDGWCLGATAQAAGALVAPINALETEEDRDGVWRRSVNDALAGPYQTFFQGFDAIIHLAAPGFETVLDWRCEQEAGLMGLSPEHLPGDRRTSLARFIQHFERITRHMLVGGVRARATVRLDGGRRVLSVET